MEKQNNQIKNILIVGSGIAGRLLEKDINKNYKQSIKIIGFVDDEERKNKSKILGAISEINKINKIYKIDEIVIAIPSSDGKLIREVVLLNLHNRIPIRIVPRSQRIIGNDKVSYEDLKNVGVNDLLGRSYVKTRVEKLKAFFKDKKILITGGAGSIGSEIVKQLIDLNAKKVIILDNSEYLVFILDQYLKEKGVNKDKYRFIIGSVLNKEKVEIILKKERPDFIFHAAAFKHVYLMEENPDEAFLNNVLGTKIMADMSVKLGVKHFIFISTDKVVNPKSVMGLTKRIGEIYLNKLNQKNKIFSLVRFGNVINSNGSVLPLFDRQIRELGFITVTHKKIKRFFMSIKEASSLVIRCASLMNPNNTYVLDMGELLSVYEIAQCLIRIKGLIPKEDIKIKIIGLKNGEKIKEELFTVKERRNLKKTELENVFCIRNANFNNKWKKDLGRNGIKLLEELEKNKIIKDIIKSIE